MAGLGGVGAFAQGFAGTYFRGIQERRLRDAANTRELLMQQKEKRLADQFKMGQEFKEEQADRLEAYRNRQLQNQEEAAQALQQYRQGQQEIQQKQLVLQQKKADLETAGWMEKAFDSTLSKGQRKYILQQGAKSLGIDKKSQEYKEFEAMLTSAEAEELGQYTEMLKGFLGEAAPGEIQATAKGMMTGKITMDNLITMARDKAAQKDKDEDQQLAAGTQLLEMDKAATEKQTKIIDAFGKVLDPKLSRLGRKAMMRPLAKLMDIDPKSDEFKSFQKNVGDMDEEELNKAAAQLEALLPSASPEQIDAFASAVATKGMTITEAIEAAQKIDVSKQMKEALGETGVPTQQVQTSRITSPTPLAQQGMGQPQGGTLPVPGMEGQTGGQMTSEEARAKASKLALINDEGARAQAATLLQYARDVEEGKNIELKVVADPTSPTGERYVLESEAVNKPAPGMRPTKTPEEEGLATQQTELAKMNVKRLEPFLAQADLARETAEPLRMFRTAMDEGGFKTGTASGLRETVARAAEFLGITDTEGNDLGTVLRSVGINDAEWAEVMDSASNQISVTLADKMSRVTNMSLGFIKSIGPSAMKTPEGNRLIIDMLERANQRALKIEAKINEFSEMGNLTPKGKPTVFDEINKIMREPLISEDEKKKLEIAAKKGQGVDWETLREQAESDTNQFLKLGGTTYEVVRKTAEGLPVLKMEGGIELPYFTDKSQAKKLKPGKYLYWEKGMESPTVVVKKGPSE